MFSNNLVDSSLVRLMAMVIIVLFIYIISIGLEKCRPRHPFRLYMLLALLGALGFFVLAQHPCYFHMPIGLTLKYTKRKAQVALLGEGG